MSSPQPQPDRPTTPSQAQGIKVGKETLREFISHLKLRQAPGNNTVDSFAALKECIHAGVDTVLDREILPAQRHSALDRFSSTALTKIQKDGFTFSIPEVRTDRVLRGKDGVPQFMHNANACKENDRQLMDLHRSMLGETPHNRDKMIYLIVETDHSSRNETELREGAHEFYDWVNTHFNDNDFHYGMPVTTYLNDPQIQKWFGEHIPEVKGKRGKGRSMLLSKLYSIAKGNYRMGYFDCEVFSLPDQPNFLPAIISPLLNQSPVGFVKADQVRVQPEHDIGGLNLPYGRVNHLGAKPILKAFFEQLSSHLEAKDTLTRDELVAYLANQVMLDQVPYLLSGEGSAVIYPISVEDSTEDTYQVSTKQGLDWSVEIVDVFTAIVEEIKLSLPEDDAELARFIEHMKDDIYLAVAITNPLYYTHKHAGNDYLSAAREKKSPNDGMLVQVMRGIFAKESELLGDLGFIDIPRLHNDWRVNAVEGFIMPTAAMQPEHLKRYHENVLKGTFFDHWTALDCNALERVLEEAQTSSPAQIDYATFLLDAAKPALKELVGIIERPGVVGDVCANIVPLDD